MKTNKRLLSLDSAIVSISVRYLIILVVSFGGLYLFYTIFTPLTVYPSFFILKVLYGAKLLPDNTIFFRGYYAQIIPACVAGSAYFLLTALNLTTPMKLKTRVKSLLFLLTSFLAANVARIIIFAYLALAGFQYFDIAHKLTWYVGSTFLVAGVWLFAVYLFKIRAIPVYSDARGVIKNVR